MSNIETKRFAIELDGVEVMWFSGDERAEAIKEFQFACNDQIHDTLELVDLKGNIVLGSHLFQQLAA